jgi:hypothetical protein
VSGDALEQILLVAVSARNATLAQVPLSDSLIRIDQFVNEWHRAFARAGSRQNELTSIYGTLALATEWSAGINTALHSYGVAELARRRLLPLPSAGRPKMTPAVTYFLIAMHNLFWLVRNRRSVAWEEGDGHLATFGTETVLAPLTLLARLDAVDAGDLIAMTELSRWGTALLSGTTSEQGVTAYWRANSGETIPSTASAAAVGESTPARQAHAELWLADAVALFRKEFAAKQYELPRVMVSVSPLRPYSLPAIFWLGHPRSSLRSHRSKSGAPVFEVRIDAALTHPLDVLRALKHQLIHASLVASDRDHTHGEAFRRAAFALGMQPRRSTRWTEDGRASAMAAAAGLGPYPRPGSDIPNLIPDDLAPSVLALRTFSPVIRIEQEVEGLPTFAGWANAWPGLRALVCAPEAAIFRQELVSRLGFMLSAPGLEEARIARFLDSLAALEVVAGLKSEQWFEFVAGLILAILGVAAEDADRDPLRWRSWTQQPRHRSLAYLTGRVARAAEDLAVRSSPHDYPPLVWRWRDIARTVLAPWLEIRGYSVLCLGDWLEGLLAGRDHPPGFMIGRRVCGFGVAEVVALWKRSAESATDEMQADFELDADTADTLAAGLAASRERLADLPVIQALLREAPAFEARQSTPRDTAADHPVSAALVRYATADASDAAQPVTAPARAEPTSPTRAEPRPQRKTAAGPIVVRGKLDRAARTQVQAPTATDPWLEAALSSASQRKAAGEAKAVRKDAKPAISAERTPAQQCSEEGSARSISAQLDQPTSILFRNCRSSPVRIYWIDYQGRRKFYKELQPGTQYVQETYLTHPWIATDETGRCLGFYMPTSARLEVNITNDPRLAAKAEPWDPLVSAHPLERAAAAEGAVVAAAQQYHAKAGLGSDAPPQRSQTDPASWGKTGRNQRCPCGSGRKYKHCHGRLA